MTDTIGLVLGVVIHAGNVQDRDGARLVLEKVRQTLELIWADGNTCNWVLEIVRRRDDSSGFEVLPRRWVVERTFGWFCRYRRLSKDYEYLTDCSEATRCCGVIHIMLRRLDPNAQPAGP